MEDIQVYLWFVHNEYDCKCRQSRPMIGSAGQVTWYITCSDVMSYNYLFFVVEGYGYIVLNNIFFPALAIFALVVFEMIIECPMF